MKSIWGIWKLTGHVHSQAPEKVLNKLDESQFPFRSLSPVIDSLIPLRRGHHSIEFNEERRCEARYRSPRTIYDKPFTREKLNPVPTKTKLDVPPGYDQLALPTRSLSLAQGLWVSYGVNLQAQNVSLDLAKLSAVKEPPFCQRLLYMKAIDVTIA